MNTVEIEGGADDFSTPTQLADWLIEQGLVAPGTSLTAADLVRAIAFRETLREVLEANAGHAAAADAVARLDEIAASVPLHVQIGDHPRLEPDHERGIDAAIGRLLGIVYEAITQGTWPRLKVCRNDTCRWAFYDSSRNRSGAWCTMAVCGNRMKGRTFRRRHRLGAAAG